jgi:cell division protein FtsB
MSNQTAAVRGRLPRIAEQAVQRARLTVVPRRNRPGNGVPFVIFVSLLLVAGVVGLLMLNTTMQQNSFRATALENDAQALAAQREGLELDLAKLNDPQVVAERAQALGMVEANVADYVDLAQKKVIASGALPATAENKLSITAKAPEKPELLSPPPKVKWRDGDNKKRNGDTGATSTDRESGTGRNGEQAASPSDRSNR